MITSWGVNSSAIAIIARWRIPPLSWWGKLSRWVGSIPTRLMTSVDRRRMSSGEVRPCAWSVSLNCAPMLFIGLSAFIALCITIE